VGQTFLLHKSHEQGLRRLQGRSCLTFFELIEDSSKNNLVSELKPVLFVSEWND